MGEPGFLVKGTIMARGRRHTLVVEIDCDDVQGPREAEDRLLRWLETFGHTAPGHGFEFFTVGRIAAKAMKDRMRGSEQEGFSVEQTGADTANCETET
jgi:hypothetical protein